MKKIALFGIFAGIMTLAGGAYADGYVETETVNAYETITIDTVTYVNDGYVAPARVRVATPTPCRSASSLHVARDCGCNKPAQKKLAPVSVKKYTEVIDHYQVYEPVVSYRPAGEYTTRRYIDAPNPHCGTCAR